MKKGLWLLFLSVMLLCAGCKSYSMMSAGGIQTDLSTRKYVELGHVEVRGDVGYAGLLKRARELYPETDAVIDIMVDHGTLNLIVHKFTLSRITSGTAIHYTDDITLRNIE